MLHRIIGFILGGITIYVILNLSTIIGDPQPRYLAAILIGLAVIALYPWLIGIWFVRRAKSKRDEEIQAEVQKQAGGREVAPEPRLTRPGRPLSSGGTRAIRRSAFRSSRSFDLDDDFAAAAALSARIRRQPRSLQVGRPPPPRPVACRHPRAGRAR